MLLKPETVAQELQMSVYTIKDWIKKEKIKAVKVGRFWRIPQEELDRLKEGK